VATPAKDQYGCDAVEPAQTKDVTLTPPSESLDPAKTYVASVETNCGAFEITLDAERAPRTAASFKHLADERFYDGLAFHRIVPDFFMQGGDPSGDGTGGPGYTVLEPPPKTLKYREGIVAMAKGGAERAGTSGSQFFVVTGEDALKLPPDYALIGNISGGQPAVERIGSIITDPRTDMPESPIVISSIRVEAVED
jgi:cyclophilin family peptidyl-prolyl cis-trans isomerase